MITLNHKSLLLTLLIALFLSGCDDETIDPPSQDYINLTEVVGKWAFPQKTRIFELKSDFTFIDSSFTNTFPDSTKARLRTASKGLFSFNNRVLHQTNISFTYTDSAYQMSSSKGTVLDYLLTVNHDTMIIQLLYVLEPVGMTTSRPSGIWTKTNWIFEWYGNYGNKKFYSGRERTIYNFDTTTHNCTMTLEYLESSDRTTQTSQHSFWYVPPILSISNYSDIWDVEFINNKMYCYYMKGVLFKMYKIKQ